MTAWGVGSFENESAAAFVLEVMQDGVVALEEAFEVVLDPDMDDVAETEGQRAIAAAEIVAAIVTGEQEELPGTELQQWASSSDAEGSAELADLAVEAIQRVLAPQSELPDIWAESDESQAWQRSVQQLLSRLQ